MRKVKKYNQHRNASQKINLGKVQKASKSVSFSCCVKRIVINVHIKINRRQKQSN